MGDPTGEHLADAMRLTENPRVKSHLFHVEDEVGALRARLAEVEEQAAARLEENALLRRKLRLSTTNNGTLSDRAVAAERRAAEVEAALRESRADGHRMRGMLTKAEAERDREQSYNAGNASKCARLVSELRDAKSDATLAREGRREAEAERDQSRWWASMCEQGRDAAEARAERLQGQLDALASEAAQPRSAAVQWVHDWLDDHGFGDVMEHWTEMRQEMQAADAAREKLINANVELKARAERAERDLAQAEHRAERRYAGIEELTALVERIKAAHQRTLSRVEAALGHIEERRAANERGVEYPWPGSTMAHVYAALVPCMARECELSDGHSGDHGPMPKHQMLRGIDPKASPTGTGETTYPTAAEYDQVEAEAARALSARRTGTPSPTAAEYAQVVVRSFIGRGCDSVSKDGHKCERKEGHGTPHEKRVDGSMVQWPGGGFLDAGTGTPTVTPSREAKYREALEMFSGLDCLDWAEGCADGFDCAETGACITTWCPPCVAKATLSDHCGCDAGTPGSTEPWEDELEAELDSPNYVDPGTEELAARGFERANRRKGSTKP